jgi:hypothetical protein
MRSKGWSALAVTGFAVLAAVAPAAAAGEGVTVETPAGPVTCAPDPAHEPGPEAISSTPFAHGEHIAISETGALLCQTSTFGEVEITGTGLPWQLTLNEKTLTARLKGTRKPGLLVQSVALPSLRCAYQAGKVLGTLTPGSPPTVSISATRVRLNKGASTITGLCPALGPLDFDVTLP